MKKKISYLILLCIMLLPITTVMADGFSSNEVISACGFGKYIPSKLPNFTSGLYNIVKLLVPVILIVMGMIDFTKAMMSSDEKKMKDSQKKFINRLIAGVVIFLIMAGVQFVFKQVDTTTSYKNGFVNCMNCILSGDIGACGRGIKGEQLTSCYGYSIETCSGKTDLSGRQCEPYNNSCRPKCSSINSMTSCGSEDHCTWSGPPNEGSCSNK